MLKNRILTVKVLWRCFAFVIQVDASYSVIFPKKNLYCKPLIIWCSSVHSWIHMSRLDHLITKDKIQHICVMRLATKTHLSNIYITTTVIIQYLHEQFTNITVTFLPFHEWLHSLNTKKKLCLEQVFNSFRFYLFIIFAYKSIQHGSV